MYYIHFEIAFIEGTKTDWFDFQSFLSSTKKESNIININYLSSIFSIFTYFSIFSIFLLRFDIVLCDKRFGICFSRTFTYERKSGIIPLCYIGVIRY